MNIFRLAVGVVSFFLTCSCATTRPHLVEEDHTNMLGIGFVASMTLCYKQGVYVKKVSDNYYEARCIADGIKGYYSVINHRIMRVK